MALAKIKTNYKDKIVKIIAGALIIVNLFLANGYIDITAQLKDEKIKTETLAADNKELTTKNNKLQEDLSYKINSESDIRIIREDLIDRVKGIVDKRDREIKEIDILRALNSTENRIMDEYIRIASLILATMETESNFTYLVNNNTNGTTDYGIMQVNEVMIPHLKEALGDNIDPINSKDDNVEGGSYEIYECYLKAKEKHPEDVIWWTYAYYNRGQYFENTDAWKNPNNSNYKAVHKQANVRSEKFRECYEAYYNALTKSI